MKTGQGPARVVFHPYVTEKTMDEMERQNRLEFVVDRTASKAQIKHSIEKLFDVKVEKVTTKIGRHGKIAMVRFTKEFSAEEIGSRTGVF
ncbi:MAG: 50S ribosomal protein L23 [Candidatus Thermoplasmatota archaeon]|jgi:large subunit ribosomal protein L23|nr:50S ribosomal protein L23 [Candidatus Thermoplasmatota archaeon]